ncbi:MAG: homoserine dehydrogenase [Flintibacter sp.]|jgi:homoserine dehydrogenase|uniref:homoserine dehydrogenase n=1 Tax=Flintibacter TaxID=1918454 RepID=UPI0001E8E40C|nr:MULTISPECIES: homoserine dehydrogenase [Eubacteriales]EGJ46705.1 homoserine dehydrogenase [Ruminococcaceae bacterium D16]MDY5037862.1 homoserine dehydrogenase [Lawsonibacter sp.]MCF2676597.1 homoserine dehydrogenase [Pseudoflavonifractor phocaeensis]MCI6148986.1 homoserine dehydrogenase [Flintibacter sp.]MCI7159225.1 homoserine dehydrogenase [Flintibacter sp.]
MTKVAILGFGTVGSGVAEVLSKNSQGIARRSGGEIQVKYILDVRDFPDSPFKDCFVKDFSIIENDPEVDVVVETIGGAKVALEFTTRALKAGKSVVSSNKELVATHGYELLQLAKANGVSYLFEASVGGGIPILRPLTNCLAANEVEQITGILNGTTNYILTRMIKAGLTFEQALKEAQDNGYAEKDPTADVDGHDACRKICILSALACGQHVYPQQVPTQGIREVTLADVAYADSCGYKIKLLGRCLREPEGKVCAFVAPHLVSCENPLAGVEDVFNAIAVTGNAVGDVMFYGRGAGKLPTASAVVADVIDIARDPKRDRGNQWGPGSEDLVVSSDSLTSRWYVRANLSMDQARLACGEILPLARSGAPAQEAAFLTQPMTYPQLMDRLAGVETCSVFRVL